LGRNLRNRSWRDVIKALARFGYFPARQSGSHIILKNSRGMIVSVPRYDPLPEGTLRAIVEEAEINMDDFLRLI
jgi:predicted RNA binding protein YcfA (HicA-like mRNA interferase family)